MIATAAFFWTLAGLILTLMVLTYIFGDNFIFRLAAYAFLGIAAGYVFILIYYQVLIPRLLVPYLRGSPTQIMMTIVPILLGALLLTKLVPQMSRLGNLPIAYLLGVGAALAAGGALIGTLIPQMEAVWQLFEPAKLIEAGGQLNVPWLIGALVIFMGTLFTLITFQYTWGRGGVMTSRPLWLRVSVAAGQVFIGLTLGAFYAGILLSALTALIDRLDFIRVTLQGIL